MKLSKRVVIIIFCTTLLLGLNAFALQAIHRAATTPVIKLKLSTATHAQSAKSLLPEHHGISHLHQAVLNNELSGGNASGRDSSSDSSSMVDYRRSSMTLSDTSMMMLACAGMIVLQLRRKQKSLHQRPLASL